jgi:hypothetical protein
MTIRKFDSSRTRVTPVFNQLLARDPSGVSWLPQLLALPRIASRVLLTPVSSTQPVTAYAWGRAAEKGLRPPRTLLAWMVEHGDKLQSSKRKTSDETMTKRQRLLRHDAITIAEAMARLTQPTLPPIAWYILEGITRPDVYLETPDILVVIEGKRTEPRAKPDTEWMPQRHQMLRHLDCAWEVRGERAVLGFFIVEGQGGADALAVPSKWQRAAQATISSPALDESLPHRTPAERLAIAAGFLGVTTWQQVCAAFQLDYTALPNRIV